MEKGRREKNIRKSESIAKIYGSLWQLLHNLQADRVYIIQPHPLTNCLFLSIGLEVRRNGVSEMKSHVKRLPMSEVAVFSAELSQRDFQFYKNIDEEVKDKKARALLCTNGSRSAIIKRLSDNEHAWIGSLICDFTRETDISPDYARKELHEFADRIQFILPELPNDYQYEKD
ncbi:MAG: hypothetical protein LIP01_02290 [Tannerellaceae bacterium]|nr:hypothetical protein [Tannerellaceae bacterium]